MGIQKKKIIVRFSWGFWNFISFTLEIFLDRCFPRGQQVTWVKSQSLRASLKSPLYYFNLCQVIHLLINHAWRTKLSRNWYTGLHLLQCMFWKAVSLKFLFGNFMQWKFFALFPAKNNFCSIQMQSPWEDLLPSWIN